MDAAFGFGYLIGVIIWGIIWGVAAKAVVTNKGYEDKGTKYFWLGFFFSFIPVIVAATKPTYQPPRMPTREELDRNTLDSGGWKCVCGNVNYNYAYSCSRCGKGKNEGDVKNKSEQMFKTIEEKSDAAKIKEFKELLDIGAITQEEFDAKKKQLLGL